jgi:3-methyladenine DNA glycosylase/8-oxoguanine DNA glycosylase
VIRSVAALMGRLAGADHDTTTRLLAAVGGIGPWTIAEVRRVAFGDPDAISVGDYHIPHLVSWVLAGEPRGSDARMLELLEPYRGQRGRVQRLLELSARFPPRRGPRLAARDIRRL